MSATIACKSNNNLFCERPVWYVVQSAHALGIVLSEVIELVLGQQPLINQRYETGSTEMFSDHPDNCVKIA